MTSQLQARGAIHAASDNINRAAACLQATAAAICSGETPAWMAAITGDDADAVRAKLSAMTLAAAFQSDAAISAWITRLLRAVGGLPDVAALTLPDGGSLAAIDDDTLAALVAEAAIVLARGAILAEAE